MKRPLPKFHAVIHYRDADQALRNVDRAVRAGADGVFLINHFSGPQELVDASAAVNQRWPDLYLGLNRLGLHWSQRFMDLPEWIKAIWADDAHTRAYSAEWTQAEALRGLSVRWGGDYFGGVAFKTHQFVGTGEMTDEWAAKEALHAKEFVPIITTSGPATGRAPSATKIQVMRAAVGDQPLAIASGITPENVAPFVPLVDHVLVATGVSDDFYTLNKIRMRELYWAIRQAAEQCSN